MIKFFQSRQTDAHNDLKSQVRQCLAEAKTEHFSNGVVGQLGISVQANKIIVELPFAANQIQAELNDIIEPVLPSDFAIEYRYQPPRSHHPAHSNIGLIVAVASGKGGVGKSTVTAQLAMSLARLGHKVGVLDADIYGPSVPLMFGLQGQNIESEDGKTMQVKQAHGVALNSIGFLIPEDKATVWRGPMASKALLQVLNETNWPELDILLVDMPPGTGDIQLTMSQTIKCDAAVIVTTPQTVALADAEKGINMFQKVATPIAGLIENMATFQCDTCGTQHQIFGESGGKLCAEEYQLPLLGQLPLVTHIRQQADAGLPASDEYHNLFDSIALSLMMQLSKRIQSVIALS